MEDMMGHGTMSRREWLAAAGAGSAAAMLGLLPGVGRSVLGDEVISAPAPAGFTDQRYKIGACDWMMLQRQRIRAFDVARDSGLDGVEVDMGGLGDRPTFDNKLADPEVRQQFLDKSREYGIEICSLAMSGFYAQSFPEREGVDRMVKDCIETMKLMGVKVAFLPLGTEGDLTQRPELRPAVVERLKRVAPAAEEAGVVIGVETSLDAEGDVKLLEDVGSSAIQVYFNFHRPLEAGRDLHEELRILGKERICQIHCSDSDGAWLQDNPRLDMPAVKQTLDEMGWGGWLVIERSRRPDMIRDVRGNFSANARYLKSVFQES
jgi:L-ribulose-5-phosphate 3-epimerase